ncbi:MAG: 4Fe-4S dicluster domain-containing protein [Firmicutes bacterium]|nr:4Fe-4S dicluster domain-containing protein [Bacillota bacterium]
MTESGEGDAWKVTANLLSPPEADRYDQRDYVNLRVKYQPGSPAHEDYYARRPELKEIDDLMREAGRKARVRHEPRARALGSAFFGMRGFLAGRADGEIAGGTPVDLGSPEEAAAHVKAVARYLGADLVGIAKLDPRWVYSRQGRPPDKYGRRIELGHRYAVVMAVERDYVLIRTAPAVACNITTGKGYAEEAYLSVLLADYLRRLGYEARGHPADDEQVIKIPVAVDAGLGELSRMGLLVTREFGARLALALATTDLELACDDPVNLGVDEFCRICMKCVHSCPGRAVPEGEKTIIRGIEKWAVDPEACRMVWQKNGEVSCAVCVAVCPWNKPRNRFHYLNAVLAGKSGLFRRLLLAADDVFYGRRFKKGRPYSWLAPRE